MKTRDMFHNDWIAYDKLPLPVIILDSNIHIIFANKAVEKIYGYKRDEFLKLSTSDLESQDSENWSLEEIKSSFIKTGIDNRIRRKHKRSDGKLIDVDLEWSKILVGDVRYVLVVVKDVSIYRKFSHYLDGQVYNNIKGHIFEYMLNKAQVYYIITDNKYIITDYGLPYEEKLDIKGKNIFKQFEYEIRYDKRLERVKSMNVRDSYLLIENFSYYPEKSEFNKKILDIHVFYIDGARYPYIIFFKMKGKNETSVNSMDILKEVIQRKDRHILLGESIAGIAHEINNPLTTVLLNIQLLMKEYAHLDEIQVIYNETVRIAKLIHNMLCFSHQSTSHNKAVNLKNSLRNILPYIKYRLKEDMALDIEFMEELYVFGDSIEIEQVMLNMLTNAIDAVQDSKDKRIEVYAKEVEDIISLKVCDTGCGIKNSILKRIFDPFFTTKDPGKGTGLGLYVVYNIIKKMYGDIKVESKEGEGTIFTLLIPKYNHPLKELEKCKCCLAGKRVLVVDEELSFLQSIRESLLIEGCRVQVSHDALMGFQMIMTEEYDLILLNLFMSGLNGCEIYKALFTKDHNVDNIILMNGFKEEGKAREFKDLYNCKILNKPFTPDELKSVLSESNKGSYQ